MPMYRTTFISHAHADNSVCAEYAALLRAQGIDLWLDLSNMQVGRMLPGEIALELVRRQSLVLLLTKTSNASHWVAQELETYIAFAHDMNTRLVDGVERNIVPVLLDGDLPLTVRDAVTRHDVASNWAKIFGRKAINAINRSPKEVIAEIVRALAIPTSDTTQGHQSHEEAAHTAEQQSQDAARLAERERQEQARQDALLPTHLHALGFTILADKAVIVPPTVAVPAATFVMGGDSDSWNGTSRATVSLAAFRIGTYPVTVAEYACAVAAHAVPEPAKWATQQQKLDHPVIYVSWLNVVAYAAWLSQQTGQVWRLPTEAEWEYAARGNDSRIYPWGNGWNEWRANTSNGGPKTTTSIGLYSDNGDASPFGLHDLNGNVWEWTSSLWMGDKPYNAKVCERNTDTFSPRVLRGGSWYSNPQIVRAASRNGDNPSICDYDVGARLVLARAR